MPKFFAHVKPLQLSKLLDGGISRTLVMQNNSIQAIRFDHNLQLDEGLYTSSLQNKYSTGSASVRSITSVDGTYKYQSRDHETEQGIKYECTPRFAENREGNRKSHFVHYVSTNAIDGKRQTFSFAYNSAIYAVKEILTSDYMRATYGEIIEGGDSLQVRTLRDKFLPTDTFTKEIFARREKYTNNDRLTLLCILTLYYLQKTFCFDQLEIETYDINCATLIKNFDGSTVVLGDREWEIYLTFLYLLSIGKMYIKDIADPTKWSLKDSSQKRFYYNLDFKPISYQNVAIGDSNLDLRENLLRIVEDISSILGYNSKILSMPYSSKNSSLELRNIINYYVYPNMIYSNAYNDCVRKLSEALYHYNDLDKIRLLEKAASDISIDESLVNCLAKEIIKDLYKTYPNKFINYIRRCQVELDTPRIALSNEATTPSEYFKTVAPFDEGVQNVERGGHSIPQYTSFGYTLTPCDAGQLLSSLNVSRDNPGISWNILTNPETAYILRNSPADFFARNRTHYLLDNFRARRGFVTGASTYEVFVEIIFNLITIAFNTAGTEKNITLNMNGLGVVLQDYIGIRAQEGTVESVRKYYKASKLLRDIIENPTVYEVTRVVSYDEVTVDIKANLFVLMQIGELLKEAVIEVEPSFAKSRAILPEHLYSKHIREVYTNLTEAARQLLSFFSDFINRYQDAYSTTNDLLTYQSKMAGGQYTENLWYNYEDAVLFDLNDLNQKKEGLAHKHTAFLNVFQDMLRYIGFDRNSGIVKVHNCSLTAHIERKLIYGVNSSGNVDLRDLDLWEPHILNFKVSIPYAEYLRLKDNENFNTNSYTLTLGGSNIEVTSW